MRFNNLILWPNTCQIWPTYLPDLMLDHIVHNQFRDVYKNSCKYLYNPPQFGAYDIFAGGTWHPLKKPPFVVSSLPIRMVISLTFFIWIGFREVQLRTTELKRFAVSSQRVLTGIIRRRSTKRALFLLKLLRPLGRS